MAVAAASSAIDPVSSSATGGWPSAMVTWTVAVSVPPWPSPIV